MRTLATFAIFICYAYSIHAQNVEIPDTALLYALIEEGVDTNGDGLISYAEVEVINFLDVGGKSISDLTGIEAFTNLDTLKCNSNLLTSLDVSNNTKLIWLECHTNAGKDGGINTLDVSNNKELTDLLCWFSIRNLNVSNNPKLQYLDCNSNGLTDLDISSCVALTHLICYDNGLSIIDVSNNTTLEQLDCSQNQLTSLDISNNTALTSMILKDMPTLNEVCVWDDFNSDSCEVDTTRSPNVYFTADCFYDSIVYIPDTAFLHALIDEGVDINGDSLISYDEAEALISLDVASRGISSMTGIEAFVNLDTLKCGCNWTPGWGGGCEGINQLKELDISNIVGLKYLDCKVNVQLKSIDLSNNKELKYLDCWHCRLDSLDVSNNNSLEVLNCGNDEGGNITNLDVSHNEKLRRLYCEDNRLTHLDVSNNIALEELICYFNNLTSLDLSGATSMKILGCSYNQLHNLDVSNNDKLVKLDLGYTEELHEVCVWDSFVFDSVEVDTFRSPNVYFTTDCKYNNDSIVFIPDTPFLYALVDEGVDTNGDSLISYNEAESIESLEIDNYHISDMMGIEAFINLDTLLITTSEGLNDGGYNIDSLDLYNNRKLKYLACPGIGLKFLNITGCDQLTYLDCGIIHSWDSKYYNKISDFNISNCQLLKFLNCSGNQLKSLDISKNLELEELICGENRLTSLYVTNNSSLRILSCDNTDRWAVEDSIVSIDISNNLFLEVLKFSFVELQDLDISHNINLKYLDCSGNRLTALDISSNQKLEDIDIGNMQTLYEVCVWEGFNTDSLKIRTLVSPNVYFTTECLNVDNVFIPDTAFLYALIDEGVDTDGDSVISFNEAEAVTKLNLNRHEWDNRPRISNLTGIEAFVNLDTLNCSMNVLTGMDMTSNLKLKYLNCAGNKLMNLNVSNCTELKYLDCGAVCSQDCYSNNLENLDLSNNTNLEILICTKNQLSTLDLSNNLELKELMCGGNQISVLNLINHSNLERLYCGEIVTSGPEYEAIWGPPGNDLSNLDLSNNINLKVLDCGGNDLVTLDLSNNMYLENIACHENNLRSLNLSNNSYLKSLYIRDNPKLTEVCYWTSVYPPMNLDYYNAENCPNVYFTTDCKGNILNVPGEYQTIQAAIDAAKDDDTVLVDEGTYFENICFKGKAITVASHFILDGDTSHISKTIIDGSQSQNLDTASVVTFSDEEDSTSVICGFTITGGTGTVCNTGLFGYFKCGGGIFVDAKSGAKIEHNIIKENHINSDLRTSGGGINAFLGGKDLDKTLIIQNNIIRYNSITSSYEESSAGGGLHLSVGNDMKHGNLILQNNLITHNNLYNTHITGRAKGGGMSLYFMLPTPPGEYVVRNNEFSNNGIYGNDKIRGGGFMVVHALATGENFIDTIPTPEIYNNVIHDNYSEGYGGGIVSRTSVFQVPSKFICTPRSVFTNNTIVNNHSPGDGDGLTIEFYNRPVLFNNIFWNDTTSNEISNRSGDIFYAWNNCIRGGWGDLQMRNIDDNPEFSIGTYELSAVSNCIGAGTDSLNFEDTWYYLHSYDMNYAPRPNPIDGYVDIGAYESEYLPVNIDPEIPGISTYRFYPNPVRDIITFYSERAGNYLLEIHSLSGQQIYSAKMEGSTIQIDLSDFQKGIYFITVRSRDYVSTEKIIKL